MQRFLIPCLAALLMTGCMTPDYHVNYPPTRKVDQVDTYHGTQVADPYRWLEDDNAADTKAWVEAQNRVTSEYLGKIPQRSELRERLTQLWNYERYGIPSRKGSRYFISKNNGLQNQSVLYTLDRLDAEPRLLLDPNTLSPDGTVALAGMRVSEDGNLIAYGLAAAGSDWNEWKVRDVRTGKDLSDHLKWVKFSGASWTKDSTGFYYSRYDEPKPGDTLKGVNYFQKLYFHRIGAAQTEDRLVYQRADQKEWGFGAEVTDEGRYLVIQVSQGTDPKNRVFYLDLQLPDGKVVELLNDFDASYNFVGNEGPVFWFLTDLNSPRGRLISIDTRNAARGQWGELIPQTAETLQSVSVLNNQFVCNYLKDAHSQVKVFTLGGTFVREVELPGIGSAGGFGGERIDTETFYAFTSFTVPSRVYRYDLITGKSSIFREPKVAFDPALYETHQVFCKSKDGTRIPMFITHKKGLVLDGNNPTLLYGYGGFNISLTPAFQVKLPIWMDHGGVYAVPSLRGGGEYGEEWHQAGTKLTKQNVFNDFISAAEWLIANHYTSAKKLAISGGSNGGLLVGACMTQRPDLFRAALPAVGVMDMLRFQKFTIGWAWASDYGSSDDAAQFKALYAYSPYHNLKPGVHYPATLVTTADHDDRVVPAHSFKFLARLQEYHKGPHPVLIRIETKAGHGAGKPTAKSIEEAADILAFLIKELEMNP